MLSEVPVFLGYGHPSGKFDLDFPAAFKARVRELAGDTGAALEVRLTPAGQDKTRAQEQGFHAMVRPWADKRGEPVDYLKQWLLAEIFGTHTYKVPGADAFITILAEPHTSQLTRRQYSDLIEGAMRLAAERDGYYLTAPDEYRKAKEYLRKQELRAAKKAEREACEADDMRRAG